MTDSKGALMLGTAFAQKGTFRDLRAVCPHCGAMVVFQDCVDLDWNRNDRYGNEYQKRVLHAGCCPGCTGLALGISISEPMTMVDYMQEVALEHIETGMENRLLWPLDVPPDKSPKGLEVEYKGIYDQARQVLPLSPMAAAVLVRRCLQHVIRTKLGITRSNLFTEIGEAVKRDELTKPTRVALDHIRKIGNWGAHPEADQANQIIDVTPEEAEYTLHVLELLFHDLYVTPERIATMDAKVSAKKQGGSQL